MAAGPIQIEVAPLTAEGFAPFGTVVLHSGTARRHYVPRAFERTDEAGQPTLWVSQVAAAVTLPLIVRHLERHPFSAQPFLPLRGVEHLAVVCHSDAEGRPDLGTLRAFLVPQDHGVTYGRDVWHHGFTALDQPAEYAVVMSLTGRNDDDVFLDLDRPVEIRNPAPAVVGASHVQP